MFHVTSVFILTNNKHIRIFKRLLIIELILLSTLYVKSQDERLDKKLYRQDF